MAVPEVVKADVPTLQTRPLRDRFAVELSDDDIETYRAIFKAQAEADWAQADALLAELDDTSLLGAILADRYLDEEYLTYYDELESWMANYADHPKAARIYRLAQRKHQSGEAEPRKPQSASKLKGFGTTSGIGNTGRPMGWKAALGDLTSGRYAQAQSNFASIAKRTKNSWYKSAAHYWAGRAAALQNNGNDAQYYFSKAAEQSYTLYGVMAASALKQPILHAAYDANTKHRIYDKPAIARASAYKQLNMEARAEEELRHAYTLTDRDGQEQLLHIAAALDLPALQLRISQALWYNTKLHHTGDYPIPSWEPAERSAQAPASLLSAIARQESGFNPYARSAAGATGVMQIMPETARYIIRRNRLNEVQVASADGAAYKSPFTIDNLTKPEVNLAVGAHYVDYLAEKSYIDNSVIHILAAYNAGPGALQKWAKQYDYINDPLLFVEHIPYKETRHYVQQVLTNYIMYEMLQDHTANAINALHAGQWPKVNL